MMAIRFAAPHLLLYSFLAAPSSAWAGEEVTVGGTASANTGYSSNPFSEVGSNTGSGYAQIQAAPEIDITNEKNTLMIGLAGQYKRFFKNYGDTYNYNANFDYKGALSPFVQTHLKLKYDSAIVGENIINTETSSDPVLSGSDLALFGVRSRRQQSQANGDVKFVLSARDTLTVTGYYILTRYDKSFTFNDYDGYGGTAGYARQISANLQLGLQGSASRYVYQFISGAETTVYSPQITFADALSAYWKLQGAVGVSFVNRGASGSSTAFSGSIDLCHSTARTEFCFTALRAVLPTGVSGSLNEVLAGSPGARCALEGNAKSLSTLKSSGSSKSPMSLRIHSRAII